MTAVAQPRLRLGRALKRAETVDGALAPALTAWDLKVLRGLPASTGTDWDSRDRGPYPAGRGLDPWMVARAIRENDVRMVRAALRGLYDRHLVYAIGFDTQRKLQRWVRTEKGDERVAANG